ncbi:MAG TPA: glycine cleavage system protein GcvH [Desulfobacteraceae bacterium]|nr:glycine cleavage system protein GcvH [Desulfobacteraceae bacterium]
MPKQIDELNFPDTLRYSSDHEWAKLEGNLVEVGLNDYAQDQLGDVVFVELPERGSVFSANEVFATVESVKAVSECYIPVGGEIVEVNSALEDSPETVNKDPYGAGWFVKVKPAGSSELDSLMTAEAYVASLKGE